MSLVVDANLIVAIALPLPFSDSSHKRLATWKQAGEPILAPVLWEYEVISALRKAIYYGWLTLEEAGIALRQIMDLNIQSVPPSKDLHWEALVWAKQLGQVRAYDAQYLALADQIGAEFWTADQRLASAAHQSDIGWVHWVGEEK